MRYSVAIPEDMSTSMHEHLLRADQQEDVLIATYVLSTGRERTTALIRTVIFPREGERLVHGTASFTSGYVLRAANEAEALGHGLVLLHSHPTSHGWQHLSRPDRDTESDYERLARAVTQRPLIGMTLGGKDNAWSARFWFNAAHPTWAESVRVVGPSFNVTWNDDQRPVPKVTSAQDRTVTSWGITAHASITRLRVLIVGGGSVGLDVAQRLAATGLLDVGVMDYDAVETVNLDRMIGATRLDAALGRAKVDVAARLMRAAATATRFTAHRHEESITDPVGVTTALDYDVIISCVDGPWARAVLNAIAYTDLIPVIDGGIAIDTFADGRMRNAIWRAHTLTPGLPCMLCNRQLDWGELTIDKQGLLANPQYIKGGTTRTMPSRQNVAALSASVSAAVLAQFVSLVAHPGRRGASGPLRYTLSTHELEHLSASTAAHCPFESQVGAGDERVAIAEHRQLWRDIVAARSARRTPTRLRIVSALEDLVQRQIAPI